MKGFWITFTSGSSGYCEGVDAEAAMAKATEVTGREAIKADRLPYPAKPVLFQGDNRPAFCYKPRQCKGNTSCPQNPSCTN